MPSARGFPPRWITDEQNNTCFIVKDATGQGLAISDKGKRATVGGEGTARMFDLDQSFLTGPDQTFAKSRKCMIGASQ